MMLYPTVAHCTAYCGVWNIVCSPSTHIHTHTHYQDTISGFKKILAGEMDHLPEIAFYMVGTVEEAVAKAEKLAQE